MANTTFKTPKGTNIELIKLKNKDYMLVVHRLLWMNEEVKSFSIDTEYLKLEDTYAICKATVRFFDENGKIVKSATATKKETAKDFPDFVEKVESSAIGRSLAMLGYGTAQSLADFDETTSNGKEVNRLADAPVTPPQQKTETPKAEASTKTEEAATTIAPLKRSTFSKKKTDASGATAASVGALVATKETQKMTETTTGDDGWT